MLPRELWTSPRATRWSWSPPTLSWNSNRLSMSSGSKMTSPCVSAFLGYWESRGFLHYSSPLCPFGWRSHMLWPRLFETWRQCFDSTHFPLSIWKSDDLSLLPDFSFQLGFLKTASVYKKITLATSDPERKKSISGSGPSFTDREMGGYALSQHFLFRFRKPDIWMVNAESGEDVLTITGPQGRINRAMWGPLNKTIISAGEDATIRIWDAEVCLSSQCSTNFIYQGNFGRLSPNLLICRDSCL